MRLRAKRPEAQGHDHYLTARCFRAERRAYGMCVLFYCRCTPSRAEGVIFLKGAIELEAEKRLGIVGIVVEDPNSVERINAVLHDYAYLIAGRMGLPHRARSVSVIALIVDGTNDEISALTGKLGRIPGVSVKSMIAKTNS
jgi:putative iron-only hydrogenase system regulator